MHAAVAFIEMLEAVGIAKVDRADFLALRPDLQGQTDCSAGRDRAEGLPNSARRL